MSKCISHRSVANAVVILALFLSTLGAQQDGKRRPAKIVRTPVPLWTDVTAAQAIMEQKPTALYDVRANQLVLYIPDSVERTGRQLRFDIPNATKATIVCSFRQRPDGTLQYRYLLTDAPDAPQRSRRVSILLPASDESLSSQANKWILTKEETTIPDRANGAHMGRMRYITWNNETADASQPLDVQLDLTSGHKPGFTDAFVEGNVPHPITAKALSELPTDVASQASRFLSHGIGDNHHFVLAPVFRPGTQLVAIASNFHYGLSALIRDGRLAPNSAYATALLQNLSTFLTSEGSMTFVLLPDVQPVGQLEASIQQAAILAFR